MNNIFQPWYDVKWDTHNEEQQANLIYESILQKPIKNLDTSEKISISDVKKKLTEQISKDDELLKFCFENKFDKEVIQLGIKHRKMLEILIKKLNEIL